MTDQLALSIAQAARAAAISRTELYRCVRRGELTLRKRGKRSLVLVEDLQRWLATLPSAPKGRATANNGRS